MMNHPFPSHVVPANTEKFETRGLNPMRMTDEQIMRLKYFNVTNKCSEQHLKIIKRIWKGQYERLIRYKQDIG